MPVRVVEIPYELLADPGADLSQQLLEGFGPDGLGIVTVSGVPDFARLRARLLPLAEAFARLPAAVRASCENAASDYNVGWSHGKESLVNGQKDVHKGSFYANPLQDTYDVPPAAAAAHPAYYSANLWPSQALPELEPAFKALGSLIVAVGLKLAGHCSKYAQAQLASALGAPLSAQAAAGLDFVGQLAHSDTHKARLLHYFPVNAAHKQQQQQRAAGGPSGSGSRGPDQLQGAGPCGSEQDWCGWHLDHGALTGLCSALYLKDGKAVPSPDPRAGLYICDRSSQVVQAAIPADHIAFQMGQVMAIQSGGLLRATPHYVRAAAGGPGVSRNTFAVFMQPPLELPLSPPAGAEALGALLCLDSGHWAPGQSFGQFAELTLSGYYRPPPVDAGAGGGAPAKDVAPAAVHVAAQAMRRLQVLVLHE